MHIFGSECTITLVRDACQTALPYSQETLREVPEEVPLDPLVAYAVPLQTVPCGNSDFLVLGCVVTRVTDETALPIAAILSTGARSPFTLLVNRLAEKRVYRNLSLTGYEIRADLDEALYIRLDIEGYETSDWDYTTPNLPWKQVATYEFTHSDLSLDGLPLEPVYRFFMTRTTGKVTTTILQLHYALKDEHPLNNRKTLGEVTLTFGGRIRLTCSNLTLLSFDAQTDNAEEILVFRRFRIDGNILIETCNDKGEWVAVR